MPQRFPRAQEGLLGEVFSIDAIARKPAKIGIDTPMKLVNQLAGGGAVALAGALDELAGGVAHAFYWFSRRNRVGWPTKSFARLSKRRNRCKVGQELAACPWPARGFSARPQLRRVHASSCPGFASGWSQVLGSGENRLWKACFSLAAVPRYTSFLASCSSKMSGTVSGTMTLPVRRKKASASVSASLV